MTQFAQPIDATEHTLADGRVVMPGKPFELSAQDQKDPHNKRLIDERQIIEIKPSKKETT